MRRSARARARRRVRVRWVECAPVGVAGAHLAGLVFHLPPCQNTKSCIVPHYIWKQALFENMNIVIARSNYEMLAMHSLPAEPQH